jgi:hypothetical protein
VESLEVRAVPTAGLDWTFGGGKPTILTGAGPGVAPPPPPPPPDPPVAVSGVDGDVLLYKYRPDPSAHLVVAPPVTPFSGFAGAVRTTVAYLNGDGAPDLVYATGPGGDEVRLIDGKTGADLLSDGTFTPYEASFTGGLYVAAGDFDRDGVAEIVVSPDVGGSARVQIFSLENRALVQKDNFFAIDDPAFRGGCRVAVGFITGDFNGDGVPDLAVGAGTGGGPRVALFDGTGLLHHHEAPRKLVGDFFAFPDSPDFRVVSSSRQRTSTPTESRTWP